MNVSVSDNEVVEPLDDGKYIIQPKVGYRFGSDSVALAKFSSGFIKKTDRVVDICSGCGIIGILIALETGAEVCGAEIDERLFDMSNRSAAANGLDGVRFFNADVRDVAAVKRLLGGNFDAAVCNPPYYKATSKSSAVAPAGNSELTVTLDAALDSARAVLKSGGALYLVHITERLDEVLDKCREKRLTPKMLIVNRNSKTFMLRCVLFGRSGMTVKTESF